MNTENNAGDFHLISLTGTDIGGLTSSLGTPNPSVAGSPAQRNATLQSTLLDTGAGFRVAPNRSYSPGSPGTLVIRRTITNSNPEPITSLRLRVTSISQLNGAPQPGVPVQPTTVAHLRIIAPEEGTSSVTTTGGTVTVQNLTPDGKASWLNSAGWPGAGLNTTLTVPLEGGVLPPGGTVNVAITLAVDSPGTFWFGYNAEGTIAPG